MKHWPENRNKMFLSLFLLQTRSKVEYPIITTIFGRNFKLSTKETITSQIFKLKQTYSANKEKFSIPSWK